MYQIEAIDSLRKGLCEVHLVVGMDFGCEDENLVPRGEIVILTDTMIQWYGSYSDKLIPFERLNARNKARIQKLVDGRDWHDDLVKTLNRERDDGGDYDDENSVACVRRNRNGIPVITRKYRPNWEY